MKSILACLLIAGSVFASNIVLVKDKTTEECDQLVKFTNPANTYAGVGGGGASNFVELLDVPNSYASEGLKWVRVKTTEDGLEFFTYTNPWISESNLYYRASNTNSYVDQTVTNGVIS